MVIDGNSMEIFIKKYYSTFGREVMHKISLDELIDEILKNKKLAEKLILKFKDHGDIKN